jgi:hypothetical protein
LIYDGEETVELDIVHGRALTPYAHHPQRLSVGVEFDPGGAPSPYRGGGAAAHHQVWVEVAKLVVEQLRLRVLTSMCGRSIRTTFAITSR